MYAWERAMVINFASLPIGLKMCEIMKRIIPLCLVIC